MAERRQLPRYVFGSSGKLAPAAGGPPAEVSIHVLSMEGALIECRNPPPVGEKISLDIEWQGATITVSAEVRSREKAGSAGLMFLEVDAESRDRLKKICAELPLHAAGPSVQPQR